MANRWVLAARPPTLVAGIAPVVVGTASAWRDSVAAIVPFCVIIVCALAIQVGVNYANDLADAHRGADTEARIGPLRTVSAGLIRPAEMKLGITVVFGVAAIGGVYLIAYADWVIAAIGVVSIIAALGYTNGPIPYGYYGLGELFVFVFFGLVATAGTRYVYDLTVSSEAWAAGVTMGLFAAAILQANNIRDLDTDRDSGKRTLAVVLGRTRARRLFTVTLFGAYFVIVVAAFVGWLPTMSLMAVVVAPLAIPLVRTIHTTTDGPELISVLKGTGQLQMMTALLLALGIAF
ncbi:MAG: 1,4-dihydroxy-2-naphthoate polyprenyltransferase [Acidimicrobiia bacterium]